MDPNEALKELRKLFQRMADREENADWEWSNEGERDKQLADAARVNELFCGLDQWLSTGGFQPNDWQQVDQSKIDKLNAKYERNKAATSAFAKGYATAQTGKQDVLLCPSKYDLFHCHLPEGHVGMHKSFHDEDMKPLAEWTDADECPICGRSDGKHDLFAHGQDDDDLR